MTKLMDPDDLMKDPPHWLFEVRLNDEPRARVFGPREKHNWVMWRLSKYVIESLNHGTVTVKRYTNGEWRDADDWRKLAH